MKLFNRKNSKQKPIGKSKINEFRSPYLSKPNLTKKKLKFLKDKKNSSKKLTSINPPRKLKQSSPSELKKILILIFSAILFCSFIYIVFFSGVFVIKNYEIVDDEISITNDLKINSIIESTLIGKNTFFFQTTEFYAETSKQLHEISKITFNTILPDKIKITIKKFQPVANLINLVTTPDGFRIQKKYQINENGLITNENEENHDLPYIIYRSKEIIQIKSTPIPLEKIKFILSSINIFEEKFGIKVLEAEYFKTEREVHLKTEKNFYIWLDIEKDVLTQLNKLKKALSKLDIYKTPLLYIDLRISGTDAEKVIYKTK